MRSSAGIRALGAFREVVEAPLSGMRMDRAPGASGSIWRIGMRRSSVLGMARNDASMCMASNEYVLKEEDMKFLWYIGKPNILLI
jgi:hypothetical protein